MQQKFCIDYLILILFSQVEKLIENSCEVENAFLWWEGLAR
jgi:hypothetical protein